jgi:alkylation response protein AidB-like acyl-CoA dehydrogenase
MSARNVYLITGSEDGVLGIWGGLNASATARMASYLERPLTKDDREKLTKLRKGEVFIAFFYQHAADGSDGGTQLTITREDVH